MPAKIDLINDELTLTGNDPVAVEDDGSPEWMVGSAAYESAIEHLIDEHDWKFASDIAVLTRAGDSADTGTYADEYARPQTSLHVVWVKVNGVFATDYRIVRNRIQINADATQTVTCKYIVPPSDPGVWNGLFGKALRMLVRAGIYRGLNEDATEARICEQQADVYIGRARTRSDQEQPSRPQFVSSIRQSRHTRRG